MAGVALAAQLNGDKVEKCRVALSGAAPVPWRAREVEKTLAGQRLTEELIKRAARAELAGARPLRQNHYKLSLFEGLLNEQLRELLN